MFVVWLINWLINKKFLFVVRLIINKVWFSKLGPLPSFLWWKAQCMRIAPFRGKGRENFILVRMRAQVICRMLTNFNYSGYKCCLKSSFCCLICVSLW